MKSLITLSESKRLIALEKTIAAGKQTFVEVGLALAEIRDSNLYRCEYDTFEEYCRQKWDWTRQRAYQLIESAEVKNALPKECQKFLTKDSHAAELAKAPAEKREEILETACERAERDGKPLTAAHIKCAVDETERSDADDVTSTEPKQTGWQDSDHAMPVFKPRLDTIIAAVDAAKFDLQAFRDGTEQFTPGGAEDVADALRTAAAAIISEGKRMKKLEVA